MTDNVSNEQVKRSKPNGRRASPPPYNAITFNRPLFQRIDTLYEQRASLGLNAEQLRLLERTHDQFVRAGAALDAGAASAPRRRSTKSSPPSSPISAAACSRTKTPRSSSTSERDLAGLPPNMREALRAAAAERGQPSAMGGGEHALQRRSVPHLLVEPRACASTSGRAFKNRGDNGDANDTNAVIADILRLRAERAQILGFPTHAHLRMADTMAHDPERAQELMMRVWPAAVARVHEEVRDMQAIANRQRANITIEPWDYNYYAEQVRRDRYNLDQNELRPYFELNNMVNGAFYMANQLYGLSFREITGTVPVFEPNVRVFEVTDRDGSYQSASSTSTTSPAPASAPARGRKAIRATRTSRAATFTPITSNNNNFVRGAAGQPVLISLDDARNAVPRIRPRHPRPGRRKWTIRASPARRATTSNIRAKCTSTGC